MMKAYHIKQWHPLYERADTRKTDYMSWYAKQTKLVGLGIGFTLQQPNNLELLGGWYLIEVLASQSALEHRGWLVRNGRPLDAIGMSSLIPMVPPEKFAALLEHFSRTEVDWLEFIEWRPTAHLPGMEPGTSPGALPSGRDAGKLPGTSPGALPSGRDAGKLPGTSPGALRMAGKNSGTDRQTDNVQRERERARTHEVSVPSLEEVLAIAAALPDPVPADYAEHYWRKKNEQPNSWFQKNGERVDVTTQLPNWWHEDEEDWRAKKSKKTAGKNGADVGELQMRLQGETSPEKRRALREQIRAQEAA